jgi:predicted ribosome quality control (RQC) complex YloA/Tae2 family protein
MNGIYLNLLISEIAGGMIDRYVEDILVKKKIVQLVTGRQSVYISLDPEMTAMYIASREKKGFRRLEKFSQYILSRRIKAVRQYGFMPVLEFTFDRKEIRLIISFYREALNLVLKTDRSQITLNPRYIEKKKRRSLLDAGEQEILDMYEDKPDEFAELLRREFEGLDKHMSGELTPARIVQLKKILTRTRAKPRIVSYDPFRISLFAEDFLKEYDSFNELYKDGFEHFTESRMRALEAAKKTALIKSMEKKISRLQSKLLRHDEIDEYRIKGELILINLAQIKKGAHQFTAKDPYKNVEMTIALDPLMSPEENAQYFFREYKKIKRGAPRITEKIRQLKVAIGKIKNSSVTIPDAVRADRKKIEKHEPYRVFNLGSGAVVYVGKNARSNNELTFAFARSDDYFFHIRGYEGAHVILRAKIPRGQRPNKKDLEAAASIAAYFSKAKTQKNVPVSYTQRKYLKKNKKGKPGSVILMREQVIFIDPRLPGEDL